MTKADIQRQQKMELTERAVENGLLPKVFTKTDFLFGNDPYAYLDSLTDPFTRQRAVAAMSDNASAVGFNQFKKTYEEYKKTKRGLVVVETSGTLVAFEEYGLKDAPEYDLGNWNCDEFGVSRWTDGGQVIACPHLIVPIRRIRNAYTGVEKVELAFKRGDRWRTIIRPKTVLASQNKIVELADEGVGVNSDNAKELVKFLGEVESRNYDIMPEICSFDRLGWMNGCEAFSPYLVGAVFDEADAFRSVYDAVSKPRGTYDNWEKAILRIRKESPVQTRLALAASLASVLVGPCGALPFFMHLWGGTEAGKTVALMMSTSVWGDPECGRYWRTFDSTAVGQEKMAGFLGNLPLIIDELMLIRDKKSFDDLVYRLSEGQGRTRGNREGGIQRQETWRLAIITTGEQPLASAASGGGAVNRVIDCECTGKLFTDPHWAANTFRENYGWFGKKWIFWLMKDGHLDVAREIYRNFYRQITDRKITTEKQASAAALLLTADALATDNFFHDGQALRLADIEPFLTSVQEVDVNERAYEYILETVAMNDFHFSAQKDAFVEQWGWKDIYKETVCINRTIFGRLMSDGGYDARSFLSWAMRKGYVEGSISHTTGKTIPTKVAKRNGAAIRYVELHNKQFDGFIEDLDAENPDF